MCNIYTVLKNGAPLTHPSLLKGTGRVVQKRLVFENDSLARTAINMLRMYEEHGALAPTIDVFQLGNCTWSCGSFHRHYLQAKDISNFDIEKESVTNIQDGIVIVHLDIDPYNKYTFYGINI